MNSSHFGGPGGYQAYDARPRPVGATLQTGSLLQKYREYWLGWFVFLLPCSLFLEVQLIGRLFLPEVVLCLVLMALVACARGRLRVSPEASKILMLGGLWLFAQIFTDVWRDTPFSDYSRGWSKIVFLLINFSALSLLLNDGRKILLFGMGWSVAGILVYFFNPVRFTEEEPWKFGYGPPIALMVFCLLSHPKVAARLNLLVKVAIILALAATSFVLGSRNLGGTCFVCAMFLLMQKTAAFTKRRSVGFEVALLVLVVGTPFLIVQGYSYAASSGLLGDDAKAKYEMQAATEYGVLLGGRAEALITTQAIADSPIIGHGSWAKDARYTAAMLDLRQLGYKIYGANLDAEDTIPTHSHLLGAWVESGIIGAVFWCCVLWRLAKVVHRLRWVEHPLAPLIIFVIISFAWDVFFSPFGADRRLVSAYALVVINFTWYQLKCHQIKRPQRQFQVLTPPS